MANRSNASIRSLARHKAIRLAANPAALSIEAVLDLADRLRAEAGDLPEVAAFLADVERWGKARRDALVLGNMGLVGRILRDQYAHALRHMGIPEEDAIQEGAIGLMRAADLFDEARGLQFSTSATNWIKQCIRRLLESDSTIRVPAYRQRSAYHTEQPERAKRPLSLDMQWGEKDSAYSLAVDPLAEREVRRSDARHDCGLLLACVEPRGRAIIECRFVRGLTLEETAAAIAEPDKGATTRERIRQVQDRSLRKMREHGERRRAEAEKRRRA